MRKIALVMALAMVLCGAALAQAAALTPGTYQDYINLGSTGGTIDDKLFFDFKISSAVIEPEDISVTPLNDPFNPGLLFSAAWTVADKDSLDTLLSYKVQVLPGGNAIKDISAQIVGFGVQGEGVVAVAETTSVGNLFLNVNGGTKDSATITFTPTMGPINVFKDISVNAPDLGDFATVSGVYNRFSEVPLPPTVLLLGSGLLGVVGFRLRRKA